MRCCTATKEGSRKMCVCGVNFKMCFPPHGHMPSSVREGCWGWGREFEVCHCLHRWQHKFNTLSENRNSAGCLIAYSSLSLSLSLIAPYLTLSLCCFASFIMLIRFACQHTHNWVWIEGGWEKRDAMMVAATTMGHEWTIVILACLWCAHHTHTHTHNRRDRQHSRHCV